MKLLLKQTCQRLLENLNLLTGPWVKVHNIWFLKIKFVLDITEIKNKIVESKNLQVNPNCAVGNVGA